VTTCIQTINSRIKRLTKSVHGRENAPAATGYKFNGCSVSGEGHICL